MRNAEWFSLITYGFFIVASWLKPLPAKRRIAIAAIGAFGILLIAGSQLAERLFSDGAGSVVRDWLPALLMPMVYWQAGQFSTRVNKTFQTFLQQLDRSLLKGWLPFLSRPSMRWIVVVLELAYLSCYVLVPAGLAVLYLAGLQHRADEYWTITLLATYPCYVFTAFVPTHPPRTIEPNSDSTASGKVRTLNMWVVRWFSIQLNTFPSAHVTATLGSSLVLLHFVPRTGVVFVLIAVAIALGAVLGRYHYAADVLVAAVLTVAVYASVLLI